jgi:uncharacterized membrane protein YbhN (UPF0104 family)/tRNA A-37 threonylcarbamoyl transferase component Bud32
MGDPATAPATERAGDAAAGLEEGRIVRSGADVVRCLLAVVVLLVAVLLGLFSSGRLVRVQDDLSALSSEIPSVVRTGMAGGGQLAAVVIPLLVVAALGLQRRGPALVRAALAVAVSFPLGIVVDHLAADTTSTSVEAMAERTSWLGSSGFPGTAYLAALAALVTALSPWISRGWRRAIWWTVAVVAVLRILSVASAPFELLAAGALGVAVGSGVLIALGAPDRGPPAAALLEALAARGLRLRGLRLAHVDAEGARHYRAEDEDGSPRFVVLTSEDDRNRDLLFRLYRYARVRRVGDEEVFRTTRSLAEHRCFLSLWAHQAGVRVPRPVLMAPVGAQDFVVVEELASGERLDDLDALDDDQLRAVWREVGLLGDAGVAHRDLRAASIRVTAGPDPEAWLVGLTWAEMSASPEQMAIDLAQALCELALSADAGRAVATGVEVLGAERLATALPFVQSPALSEQTRKRVRKAKGLLDEVREELVGATGAEDVPLEKLERITLGQVGMVAGIGLAVYLLLPMVASIPEVWDALQDASWGWIVATLPLVGVMYVGSTLNFMGAVPDRLPFFLTYEVQLASAFMNRVTPKNVGGMALRLRFLTKRGTDPVTAAGSVGLTSVAGTVSTTVLMVLAFLAAGRTSSLDISLPSFGTLALVILGVGVLLVVFALTPVGHRLLIDKAWGWVRGSVDELRRLLTDPAKVSALLGGSALTTLAQILALDMTLVAFGVDLHFAQVAVVFLFANLVASASPTPGGIGVVEASQVFLLTQLGVGEAEATSAVLVCRFITFWLVIGPGWVSLRRLRGSEAI